MNPVSKATPETAGAEPPPGIRWALAGLSLAMLLATMGASIPSAGLPALARAFGASFGQVQWVIIAYLLGVTTLVVGVGRLGDIIGRRRLMLAGIALFTAASALCGLAPTLALLAVARAGQGVGAAIMMALAMAMLADTAPKARTGSAMGLLGTMSAIGTALGPSLGGMLIAGPGWQAMFLINLLPGIVAFALVRRYMPADRREASASRAGFDAIGTALLALTLAAYALAMTVRSGGARDGFGKANLSLLLAAAIGAGLFLAIEAKVPSPLIRLAMFRERSLGRSLATSILVSTVMMSTLVVGPFYLAGALALDAARVGLVLSTGPAVVALAGVPAGRLADRFGAQRMSVAGLAAMVAGSLGLALSAVTLGVAGYVVPLMVLTSGYALFQTANNTAVMGGVAADRRGVIAGMLNLARNLGLITGASAMGAVFAFASAAPNIAAAHPEALANGMRATFLVAAALIAVGIAIATSGRREAP